MRIAGIDEAGRGPIIGPMVMAIVVIEPEQEKILKQMGVRDSKLILPEKRKKLFKLITKQFDYDITIISPQQIDQALFSDNLNLNWLEALNTAKLLNNMPSLDRAILDCPSQNPEAYKEYVKKKLNNQKLEIVAEHKADQNHLVVGAASIIAKVTRDSEIEKIKQKHHIQFGSGYPSDPQTKEFIQKNYAKDYDFIRKSWESYKRLIRNAKQKNLFDKF